MWRNFCFWRFQCFDIWSQRCILPAKKKKKNQRKKNYLRVSSFVGEFFFRAMLHSTFFFPPLRKCSRSSLTFCYFFVFILYFFFTCSLNSAKLICEFSFSLHHTVHSATATSSQLPALQEVFFFVFCFFFFFEFLFWSITTHRRINSFFFNFIGNIRISLSLSRKDFFFFTLKCLLYIVLALALHVREPRNNMQIFFFFWLFFFFFFLDPSSPIILVIF